MFSQNSDEKKLDWIYKNPTSLVDREEYLLGRPVDKTLDLLNAEEKQKQSNIVLPQPKNHVEHECIPPSIRDFKLQQVVAEQVDLSAKLQEDPVVAIKKREEETRRQFLQNPVQLKKLQEALKAREQQLRAKKKKSKSSSKDLDRKIAEKLQLLKTGGFSTLLSKKEKKKRKSQEEDTLNTILMHKFNELKDKLTDDDLRDILSGKISDSESSSESSSEDEIEKKKSSKTRKKEKKKKRHKKKHESSSESESDEKCETDVQKRGGRNRSSEKRKIAERAERRKRPRSRSKDQSRGDSRRNRRLQSPDEAKKSYDSRHEREKRIHEVADKGYRKRDIKYKARHRSRSRSRTGTAPKSSERHGGSNSGKTDKKTQRNKELSSASCSSSDDDDKRKNARHHSDNSDDDRMEIKQNYGLVKADGSKIKLSHRYSEKKVDQKTKKTVEESNKLPEKSARPLKLSEEEKERRRREMMENAAWHDKEREQNVKRYRENDAKESIQEFNPDFLHQELLKSANSSTVESRIKSNINKIQRSKSDMNSHFSRR